MHDLNQHESAKRRPPVKRFGVVLAIVFLGAAMIVPWLLSRWGSPGVDASPGFREAATTSTSAAPTGDDGAKGAEPLSCLAGDGDGHVWRLSFHEDFAGPDIDAEAWILYDSVGNAGFGLRRPEALTIENGLLVITARMIDGALVSGGMAHVDDQVYGRWEFRVRTEADPSQATSGVVLTWPQSENWPVDGENDMYETGTVADRNPFRTYIHYGESNQQEYLTHDVDGTGWHELAMEWTADRIAMFRDGAFVGEITNEEAIPDVAHHMAIQLDAWAAEMGDPVRLYVDWVRIYRLDEGAGC